jgi:hypothetical protein
MTKNCLRRLDQVTELRRRVRSAESSRDAATADAAELRAAATAAASSKAEADVALCETRAMLAARDERVSWQQEK